MTLKNLYVVLGKTALVLLIASGLISALINADLKDLFKFESTAGQEIQEEIDRVQCLQDALPQGEEVLGFLPALPKRMEDPKITSSIIRLRADQYRLLFLTQYALAPRVIAFYDAFDWIVANYPDQSAGLEAIRETNTTIVQDCGNGVFLLKK